MVRAPAAARAPARLFAVAGFIPLPSSVLVARPAAKLAPRLTSPTAPAAEPAFFGFFFLLHAVARAPFRPPPSLTTANHPPLMCRTGHTKGVSKTQFLPNTAHLMLSCGLDSKIKLWEVYGQRRCLRTFHGHSQAVRDITFNNDGTKFLSAGYDRMVRLWDTETGQMIRKFTNKKIPYCVKFNPNEDKQHLFVAGTQDKKILCYDINSGETVQEYDRCARRPGSAPCRR